MRVKLQHECAARELWAVLADLPSQALLLKTNLLHSVLDLVGAPYSQADIGTYCTECAVLHVLNALYCVCTLTLTFFYWRKNPSIFIMFHPNVTN